MILMGMELGISDVRKSNKAFVTLNLQCIFLQHIAWFS